MTTYKIVKCESWKKPGCSSIASTQVGDFEKQGYVLAVTGYRIKRDGKTLYPSYPSHATEAAAAEALGKFIAESLKPGDHFAGAWGAFEQLGFNEALRSPFTTGFLAGLKIDGQSGLLLDTSIY